MKNEHLTDDEVRSVAGRMINISLAYRMIENGSISTPRIQMPVHAMYQVYGFSEYEKPGRRDSEALMSLCPAEALLLPEEALEHPCLITGMPIGENQGCVPILIDGKKRLYKAKQHNFDRLSAYVLSPEILDVLSVCDVSSKA